MFILGAIATWVIWLFDTSLKLTLVFIRFCAFIKIPVKFAFKIRAHLPFASIIFDVFFFYSEILGDPGGHPDGESRQLLAQPGTEFLRVHPRPLHPRVPGRVLPRHGARGRGRPGRRVRGGGRVLPPRQGVPLPAQLRGREYQPGV